MKWSWAEYLATPVDVIEAAVSMLNEEALERQQAQQLAAVRRGRR